MHPEQIDEITRLIARELSQPLEEVAAPIKAGLNRFFDNRIAVTWSTNDVLAEAEGQELPLTEGQAHAVLQQVFKNHDPEQGISWFTIQVELEKYVDKHHIHSIREYAPF